MLASGSHFSPDIEILGVLNNEAAIANLISEENPSTYGEAFLKDYDPAKYQYDYSNTSTAFNLPNYHKFQEIQPNERYSVHYMGVGHPNFKAEISKIFLSNLFRTQLTANIKFIDGARINNSRMHDNLMFCRNMLAKSGQNSDFTYLFLLAPGYDPIFEDQIFSVGPKCGNLPAEYLGDPTLGVVLSSHPDTCTLSPLIPFIPYRIIIFKALQGSTRFMPINSKTYPNNEIPEDSFGANSAIDERGAETMFDIYTQSLVYVYDKKDSENFYLHPRTLYPYAAVTFYIDAPYHPTKPLRLPWYSSNIACKTTFNVDPMYRIPVNVYRLFDNNSAFTEFAIDGISVRKIVSFTDLGRWSVLKELFSGVHGDLYDFDQVHIQSQSLTSDYFISHCIIASDDPSFIKIVRGMIVPQVGALFAIPYIPKMSTADSNGGKSCGLLLPNSAFASLFGVPIIPGDILHCFFIHRVVIGSAAHPLRTVKREEMLIGMSKNGRISRSDKVSDNDIRVALHHTLPTQIMSVDLLLDSCTTMDEREKCRAQIIKQLLQYEEPKFTLESCKYAMECEENEYQKSINNSVNNTVTFTPARKNIEQAEVQYVRCEKAAPVYERMEVDSPVTSSPTVTSLPSPTSLKTAVILDPRMILDTQINPTVLETMLQLTADCTNKGILSQFTVIYHQCMRSNRITDNLNIHSSNVNPQRIQQYQQLEEAYSNKHTIQFAPEHTCDSKRTALRAAVVCILTILRKYTFNNAVLLTYAAVTDEAIFFQQHKTCLMTPEEYIDKLRRKDPSFLY